MDAATLKAAVGLACAVAVMGAVLSMGLGTSFRQAAWLAARPGLLLRSAVAALVLVPLAGLLLALGLGLPRPVAIGVILMAVSPAAPMALRRASDASGHDDYTPGLQLLLAALAVLTVPATCAALERLFPPDRLVVTPADVALQVGRVQLLPLLAGMALRARFPALAERARLPLQRAALALLGLASLGILAAAARVLAGVGAAGFLGCAAAVAVSLLLGHLLGGGDPRERTALAVASAMRNPGLALLIVQRSFPAQGVGLAVVAYALTSLVVVGGYVRWRRRQHAVA